MSRYLWFAVILISAAAHTQGPWLGGQKEYALGVQLQSPSVLGLYVSRKTGTSFGDVVNKTSIDLRLGWMGWKVVNGLFAQKPCLVLDTDAYTTQVLKGGNLEARSTIKLTRQTYVSLEGKVLRETYTWQDASGNYRGEALFGKDEIELTTSGPKGTKTTTIFPADGMAPFDAAFTPMIKNGEVTLREKTFAVLNPVTGAPLKVTARISNRFDWTQGTGLVKKKGQTIDFIWPDHTQKAYITDKGELCKVDLPAQRILLFEEVK
ncbi:MAG: hypothetical protein WAO58_13480 [Fimbriimonadaceae bacterium]